MDEKRFYDEKEETKQIPLTCPHCRQEGTFPVRWIVSTKKTECREARTIRIASSLQRLVLTWSGWTIWWPAATFDAERGLI